MDRLTDDLVVEILFRLPVRSLIRFRCVCRSWRNLAGDPRFLHYHLTRSSQANPSLILITSVCIDAFFFFYTQLYVVEHLDSREPTCSEVPHSLPNVNEFQVFGSCNGLLCLVHRMDRVDRHNICVCNPFTRESISLPNPVSPLSQSRNMVIGFGFSPKTSEYKVVAMVGNFIPFEIKPWEVSVCTLGRGSWRAIGSSSHAIDWQRNTALVNGALHWFSYFYQERIVTFDITHEVFGEMPGPETAITPGAYSSAVLSECLAIMDYSFYNHAEIWIMKDYGVKESWAKCYSISFNEVGWKLNHARVLCLQKDGELLILYNHQVLLSYNPKTMRLRKLSIAGLPSWFYGVTHVASLVHLLDCF